MANPWFRLWSDMINDPKWRTISRASGQKIGDVIATYIHMMTCASNATERGRTEGWSDEDVATALDLDTQQIAAIREAMQGRVLDGDYLRGWEKRQPIREDGAAERAKAWREAKKDGVKTQPNATERNRTLEEIREEEIREEGKSKSKAEATQRASRLPADWTPTGSEFEFCQTERPELDVAATASRFRDYWIAQPGAKGRKVDWSATWRNWVRNERLLPATRASPQPYESTRDRERRETIEGLTGRKPRDEHRTIDV